MQIAANLAVVRAAYTLPAALRPAAAPNTAPAPDSPETPEQRPAGSSRWDRWPAAQIDAGLPADDFARYTPDLAPLTRLTPADRELLHAVTSTVISADGTVHVPSGGAVDPLVDVVAQYRLASGQRLQLTAGVVSQLVADATANGIEIDAGHLDRATEFLAAGAWRSAEDPHPRTSFSMQL